MLEIKVHLAYNVFLRIQKNNCTCSHHLMFLCTCHCYRALLGSRPSYLLERMVEWLALPQPRTDYILNSFSYSGAALSNGKFETFRQVETRVRHVFSLVREPTLREGVPKKKNIYIYDEIPEFLRKFCETYMICRIIRHP